MSDNTTTSVPDSPQERHLPTRASEIARLEIAKLTVESGVSLEAIIRRVCELSAQTLRIGRVGVWMFIDAKQSLRCSQLYEADQDAWSEGAMLQVADFPDYFNTLCNRKVVPAECAMSDPKTSELVDAYLKPLGITSMLDAPIFSRGEVVGVLCNEHIGPPREWSTEDRDFSASLADLLAIKIRAAEVLELEAALRTNEAQIVAMEKSDALAKMALGVAHDFRNLLTTINNCTHVLKTSPHLPPELAETVQLIATATEQGTRLICELVDYGRNQPAKPYPLNLKQVIEDFMPVLRSAVGSQNQIHLDHSRTPGRVFIDRNQFDRILLNLALNARDAMPDGGLIEIRTYDDKRQNFVTLEMRDYGVGMDDETKARLFEPFFTSKPHGTGLGMAIVQRIVERAGGTISVESQSGVGTTVRVHFPRVSSAN